jgi:hypothetical protein
MPKKQEMVYLIKFPPNIKFKNNSPYILKLKTGKTSNYGNNGKNGN